MRKTAAIRAAGVSVWERRSTCRVARAASPRTVAAAVPVQGRVPGAGPVRALVREAAVALVRGLVRVPVRERVLVAEVELDPDREVEAAAVRVLDQGAGREADRVPVPARGQEREPVREQVLAAVLVVARGRGPALVAAVAAALALVQEWDRVQELVVAPAVEVAVEVDRGRVAAVALVVERAPAQERAMEPVRETGPEQGAALGRVAARDRVPGVPAVALSSAAGSGMRLHRRGTFLRTVPSSRSTAAM